MHQKILVLVILFLLLISSGCAPAKTLIQSNDVLISPIASPFGSVNEYHAFFGITSYGSEVDEKEKMKNYIMVRVNWDLTPEKRVEDYTKLYYPPYIIVIQPDEPFTYAGTGNFYNGKLISSVGSIPSEVLKNVLSKNKDFKWDEIDKERFGWVIHPKSFGQGFATIAFIKTADTNVKPVFKIYYIYYDPILKDGWVKSVETH